MRTIVFYHSPCHSMDGYVAAWLAHKHLGDDDTRYVGVNYGGRFPVHLCDNNRVYVLDFSLRRELMARIIERSDSIVILDHHKSAARELAGLGDPDKNKIVEVDLERSGARMTWDHFSPETEAPILVKYVEDRDLWRFWLENSRIVNDWIAANGEDPRNNWGLWDDISDDLENHMDYVLDQARAIRQYKDRVIEALIDNAHPVELSGYCGMAVNQSCANMISEVAGRLADTADFGACYYRLANGMWKISLRSHGETDVSELAAQYGGDGRTRAAGFMSTEPLATTENEVCAK